MMWYYLALLMFVFQAPLPDRAPAKKKIHPLDAGVLGPSMVCNYIGNSYHAPLYFVAQEWGYYKMDKTPNFDEKKVGGIRILTPKKKAKN